MTATWTAEREATLRRLWLAGASASAIARALGGVTRNAVIGKVHRLGIYHGQDASRPAAGFQGADSVKPDEPDARAAVRVVEVPYPTSNSGVALRARVSLPREPWA